MDGREASVEAEHALDEFVARFEAQAFSKTDWTHAAHLRVGGCYLLAHGGAGALEKMRAGIRRLNDAQGVANSDTSGYHETLTCFWLALISRFMTGYRVAFRDAGRAELIEKLVLTFGARAGLYREYWSFDVAGSVQARRAWVPADRIAVDVSGLLR